MERYRDDHAALRKILASTPEEQMHLLQARPDETQSWQFVCRSTINEELYYNFGTVEEMASFYDYYGDKSLEYRIVKILPKIPYGSTRPIVWSVVNYFPKKSS